MSTGTLLCQETSTGTLSIPESNYYHFFFSVMEHWPLLLCQEVMNGNFLTKKHWLYSNIIKQLIQVTAITHSIEKTKKNLRSQFGQPGILKCESDMYLPCQFSQRTG
jgi:hypothetical protein